MLGRRVLHDGAVAPEQLLAHGVAGAAVDQGAPDLVAPPDAFADPHEVLAARLDLVGVVDRPVGTELTAQVLLLEPGAHLEGHVGVVADHEVDVVPDDRAADAPGEHAVLVGERVEAVLGPLDHGERRVQEHPVQQVGQLADAAADAGRRVAVGEPHADDVALAPGAVAHHLVEREGLARPDHHSVGPRARQPQVDHLVVLERHLVGGEIAEQQRAVLLDADGQLRGARGAGRPARAGGEPVGVAAGLVETYGEGIEPRVPLGQPAAGESVHVHGMRRGSDRLPRDFGTTAGVWQTSRLSPARCGPSHPRRGTAHRRSRRGAPHACPGLHHH